MRICWPATAAQGYSIWAVYKASVPANSDRFMAGTLNGITRQPREGCSFFRFPCHTLLAFPFPYSSAVACTLLLGRLIKSSIWSCARGCSSACPRTSVLGPRSSVCGCSCICDNKNTCWQPPPVIAVAPTPLHPPSSLCTRMWECTGGVAARSVGCLPTSF